MFSFVDSYITHVRLLTTFIYQKIKAYPNFKYISMISFIHNKICKNTKKIPLPIVSIDKNVSQQFFVTREYTSSRFDVINRINNGRLPIHFILARQNDDIIIAVKFSTPSGRQF